MAIALIGGALLLAGCFGGDDGGKQQTLVIVGDLSISHPYMGDRATAMAAAIKAVIRASDGRAGPFVVRYAQSQFGATETQESCMPRGERYARDRRVRAVIGPDNGACSRFLVPALNRAGMVAISPNDELPGLTHEVPGDYDRTNCLACSPAEFYPTGARNYVRLIATPDSEGRAAARLLADLGHRRAFVLDWMPYYMQYGFVDEAKRVGVRVVKWLHYGDGRSYAVSARSAVASGADAVFLVAPPAQGGMEVLRALQRVGFSGVIVGSLNLAIGEEASVLRMAGAATAAYFTSNRLPLAALSARAREFVTSIGGSEYPADAVLAADATTGLLKAIATSDGTRAGIREELFKTTFAGLTGQVAFDANGDVRPQRIAIYRSRSGRLVYLKTIAVR